jgi:hypothetical protein
MKFQLNNKQYSKSNFFYLNTTSLLFVLAFFLFLLKINDYFSIIVFIINIIFIIKFKKRIPICLIFIYFLLHSKIFLDYFIFKKQISFWTDFQFDKYMAPVLFSHLLFLFTLGIFLNSGKIVINNFNHFITQDKKVYILILIVSIYFLIYGLSGDNIFTSGMYNSGDVNKSTLHEYFILFFIVSLLFIPNLLIYKITQLSLLLFYILKTFIYGARIEAIEIILVYVYFYFILLNKIKIKYIIIFILFGIYFMLVISNIRNNPTKLFSNNFTELFYLSDLLNFQSNEISSTEGDVVQSSARMIGILESGYLNYFQRLHSFFIYISSPILPQSYMPDYANLSTYLQSLYSSGGGGLISTYFFCWLGYIGPIIIAFILSILINNFYKFNSKLYFLYGLALISTFPRWFSYNPIFIVKFCFYTVIVYLFFLNFKKIKYDFRY